MNNTRHSARVLQRARARALITINVICYYYFIIRADDVYCAAARGGIAFN